MEDHELHDIAIVGAGPCGLAVASRLCESTPAALFTDVEHQRYHWIRKHSNRVNLVQSKGRAYQMRFSKSARSSSATNRYSMLVVDSTSDTWMERWKSMFRVLDIKQLRSPLFFHVDPRDRDGLKEYAHLHRREKELMELSGVAGKELSKHRKKKARASKGCHLDRKLREGKPIDERDAQDYFTPSRSVFDDFCKTTVNHYSLSDLVKHEAVQTLSYHPTGSTTHPGPHFVLQTTAGLRYARVVVMATGPGSSPFIPCHLSGPEKVGACHTSSLPQQGFLASHVSARIAQNLPTNVLVVGSGLTSAQVVDLCVRSGVTCVWHLMHGPYKVKHFDLATAWVAKYRNLALAEFWTAETDEERFNMIKEAKGGGSITPSFRTLEMKHVSSGRVRLSTHTEVMQRTWDPETKTWRVETQPHIKNLPDIDYIYYATGVTADIHAMPILENLMERYPLRVVGGLPCITDDLQWNDNVPLFIAGRFAGLRLGPGAANLEGAKVGAERIAWKVQELLRESQEKTEKTVNFTGSLKGWREQFDENMRASNTFAPLLDDRRG